MISQFDFDLKSNRLHGAQPPPRINSVSLRISFLVQSAPGASWKLRLPAPKAVVNER
jgi:hypothetical protein